MNITELAIYKKMFGGNGGANVSGTVNITENGEHDVAKYEKAIVEVPVPTNSVIEVNELPTENINFDAVYAYNGDLYKGSNTWVLNDTLTNLYVDTDISISQRFTAAEQSVTSIRFYEEELVYWAERPITIYNFTTKTWVYEPYKTITLTEEPTDETFIAWLKENATRQWYKYTPAEGNNPTAYHLTSVDELPADAVDGSVAVVESDSVVGEWLFYLEISSPPSPCKIKFISMDSLFTSITDEGDGFYYYNAQDEAWTVYYYGAVWEYDNYREIEIIAEPSAEVAAWVRENAIRISGGHTLYSRENGEWVNKGEI